MRLVGMDSAASNPGQSRNFQQRELFALESGKFANFKKQKKQASQPTLETWNLVDKVYSVPYFSFPTTLSMRAGVFVGHFPDTLLHVGT